MLECSLVSTILLPSFHVDRRNSILLRNTCLSFAIITFLIIMYKTLIIGKSPSQHGGKVGRLIYFFTSLLLITFILLIAYNILNEHETEKSKITESKVILNVLAFSDLVNSISKKEFYEFEYEEFTYNVTVIQSNNMSIAISKNGLLSIYLENKGDKKNI